MHLAGALGIFISLEGLLMQTPLADFVKDIVLAHHIFWLVVIFLAFVILGWVGHGVADSISSVSKQYLWLGIYVVVKTLILFPLLFIAAHFSDSTVILNGAVAGFGLFVGLIAAAFAAGREFSLLRAGLTVGGLIVLDW